MSVVDGIETDEMGKPIFVGESLSLKDRTIVRSATTNWLKECMANGLKDASTISSQKRFPIMRRCLNKIQSERDKADDTTLEPCSPQAVLEEIDFYLPKSFWRFYMNIDEFKSGSAANTLIDPEWPEFIKINWHFMFEESKSRLYNDYAGHCNSKHRYAISSREEWSRINGKPFRIKSKETSPALKGNPKIRRPNSNIKKSKASISQQNELIFHRTVKAVQDAYGIPSMEFLGPSRSRRCVQARNISIFLYKKLSGDTMSNTGKLFERDHTTIIHSIEKIKDQLKEDEELHDRINGLSQMIQK